MNGLRWHSANVGDLRNRLGDGWAPAFVEREPAIAVRCGGALLWTCITRGGAGAELANALFDSFFPHLPPGARAVAERGHLVLPRLGLHLRSPCAVSVAKVSDGSVFVRSGEGGESCGLAGLPEHARIQLAPTGFAQSVLYDVVAIEKLVGRTVDISDLGAAAASERIAAGLALIELGGGIAIADRVREYVQFIVPIASAGDERKSYSYRDAPGIAFVSPRSATDWIAEAIVHEAAHIELETRMVHSNPLFPSDIGAFYSPWKAEPRSAEAVLHGAFSFWRAAEYLVECVKRGCATDLTARRAFQTLFRVRLALGQLKAIDAMAEAKDLIDMIERRVLELCGDVPLSVDMPLSVRVHMMAWMRRHPDLAGGLRPPVE